MIGARARARGQKTIPELVEEGPMHRPNLGIYQWRIKPLKRQLAQKCVFWQAAPPALRTRPPI